MSQMIQALERRMLMSVTAATLATDIQTVNTDCKALTAANTSRYQEINADIREISTGLRGADTKSNRVENTRFLLELELNNITTHAKLVYDVNGLNATARYTAVDGAGWGRLLLNHPTVALYQTRVGQFISYGNSAVPDWINSVQSEQNTASSTLDADAEAIATNNSTLITAVTKLATDLQNTTTAVNAAAAQVQTDITQFTSDLGAIPT